MDVLIEDLLDYSRIARSDMKLEPVDVDALIDGVVRSLAGVIHESHAKVRARHYGHHRALGDPTLLTQVVTNLVSNALKFVPPGRRPVVEVGADEDAETVKLWVRDNGIGIEGQYRDRVFRLFERLHGREQYPGTGIGLAIVSKAVERMGGHVGFESTPGKGSRFWVQLRPAELA
jgi:signal transduction histidine kinase